MFRWREKRDAFVALSPWRTQRWHPLGYKGAFGYRLRYFITAGEQRLGCLLLAGAARALAVRDQWIGWDAQARRANQVRVLNNSRFLIFPHVQVRHLDMGKRSEEHTSELQSR